jgi:hypothetical protein
MSEAMIHPPPQMPFLGAGHRVTRP